MRLRHRNRRHAGAGFTLIETLIAMVFMATGLLGVAKIQAMAVSSTKTAGSRSLIALQTGSLTAAMHANKAFWAAGLAPPVFTVAGTTISDPSGTLGNGVLNGCLSRCTPVQLAANDLKDWANDMQNQFPGYDAKVNCSDGASAPVSCTIFVEWSEKTIAFSQSTAAGAATHVETASFSVHVKP